MYAGDIVSFEIISEQAPADWQDASVKVFLDSRDGEPIAQGDFGRFGIGGRAQATLTWVWDTSGLDGTQTLIIMVDSADVEDPAQAAGDLTPPPAVAEAITLTVELLPAAARPMPEPLAQWTKVESECCIFHYLTGTAAERDIALIQAQADAAFAHVEAALGVTRKDKSVFTLLSRLLGHGGFATEEISLTYIDRNPTASSLFNVFAHEGTHILDRQIAQPRPTFMTEGLAVYAAGGHFRAEDLEARAAALLALDRYIPLASLADNFYLSQHEIGYLEGGAFITYLVGKFGWERFRTFFASFKPAPTDAQALEDALQANFDRGLEELETEWLQRLEALPPDQGQMDDLRLSIALYDTLRRYQKLKDPAAYFLTAWLPDGREARRRGIVADFVRHPATPEHVALEAMLASAGGALHQGQYAETERLLAAANAALDANTLAADPLATDYLEIVTHLSSQGYEAQTIVVDDDAASATAIRDWPSLGNLTLTRRAGGWTTTLGVFDSR